MDLPTFGRPTIPILSDMEVPLTIAAIQPSFIVNLSLTSILT